MKVLAAHEDAEGRLVARVEFDDGMTQTVIFPTGVGVTRGQIVSEAQRRRRLTERDGRMGGDRQDLVG